jgi:glycolate oxidase FAD binding subunit
MSSVDLMTLSRVVDFSPDDMTVTVEAGLTVEALQRTLATAGQWLPIDPPHAATTSIADLLHDDISGPRRFAHGTIREHVIGMAAVLGDGRLVRSGGRVVKNVAGYDIAKLLVGDRRRLGLLVEVTFKLSPLPAVERCFTWSSTSLDAVDAELARQLGGPTEPVLVDLHNLDRPASPDAAPGNAPDAGPWSLVIGFAGHGEDVAWQAAQLDAAWTPLDTLVHDDRFWTGRAFAGTRRMSVLPSRLVDHVRTLPADVGFVARAGNGVVYTAEPREPTRTPSPLEQRLEATYDPHHILSGLS